MPAVKKATTLALVEAAKRLGTHGVRVVLDCDDEVIRLGYGDVQCIRELRDRGLDVRQCGGLRVGLVVVDGQAWTFTPTALYVQPEVQSVETPNALQLPPEAADKLVAAVWDDAPGLTAPAAVGSIAAAPEIGQVPLDASLLTRVEESIRVAPPMPFDVARQVRVFQPYIQYVEVSLRGCAIQRRRITIPKSIQTLGASPEIESRLRTTFDLIEENSDLSSRALEVEQKKLLDDFTRSLGKPWGRVLLRAARERFDKRVVILQEKVEKYKRQVRDALQLHLDESLDKVLDYYLPLAKKNPPDGLLGQLMSADPADSQIRGWLLSELEREFPDASHLVSDMRLDVQFRDVTYETLNEKGFAHALRKAYPHVNWEKPFDEFKAAKEKAPVASPGTRGLGSRYD